jgi:hypothetical protein
MAMPRLVVTFDDGEVKTVSTARPSVMLAMEQRFGRQNAEGIWEICWLAFRGIVGVPPEEGPEFDAWIDSIAEIDFDVDEVQMAKLRSLAGTPAEGNGDVSPPAQPPQFVIAPSPAS